MRLVPSLLLLLGACALDTEPVRAPLTSAGTETERTLFTKTCQSVCGEARATRVLTFDVDHGGVVLPAGSRIVDAYEDADLGMRLSQAPLGSPVYTSMRSLATTDGRPEDLAFASPHEDFGGAGVGDAGSATGEAPNRVALGQVVTPMDALGRPREDGGRLRFALNAPHADAWCLDSVRVLNTPSDAGPVDMFAMQDLNGDGFEEAFDQIVSDPTGINGVVVQRLGVRAPAAGPWSFEVEFPAEGALDSLTLCAPLPPGSGGGSNPNPDPDPGGTDNRDPDGSDNRGSEGSDNRDGGEGSFDDLVVQGGGGIGCASAGPAGGWWLAAAGLLVVGRRRRRRDPAKSRSHLGVLAGLGLVGGVLGATDARAQATGGEPRIDIQRFDPVPQPGGMVRIMEAEVPRQGTWSVGGGLNYAYAPLELGDADGTRVRGLVDHLVGADILASWTYADDVQIGIDVPILQIQDPTSTAELFGHSGRRIGMGDIAVTNIFQVANQGPAPVGVAIAPKLTLPTGAQNQFISAGAVRFGLDASVAREWRPLRMVLTGGFQFRDRTASFAGLEPGHTVRGGLGLIFPVQGSELGLEYRAARSLSSDTLKGGRELPMELMITFRPGLKGGADLVVGGGGGLTRGYGAPAARGFVLGRFIGEPEPEVEYDPAADTDGDGYVDPADACPLLREDFDMWNDRDGCPDLDNDRDGVPDLEDECPYMAGDFGTDCPTYLPDRPGAAPPMPQLVLTTDEILLPEDVHFDFDKATIRPESRPLLDAVVEVLQRHPELEIEVRGHTDAIGSRAYNRGLSRRRAAAVRGYLVDRGVEADRLTSKGFGERRPIADNDDPTGRLQNRRVAFIVR